MHIEPLRSWARHPHLALLNKNAHNPLELRNAVRRTDSKRSFETCLVVCRHLAVLNGCQLLDDQLSQDIVGH